MPIGRKAFDESDCNAINDNIDNERRLAAMHLSEDEEGRGNPSPMTELFLNGKTISSSPGTSMTSSPTSSDSSTFQKTPDFNTSPHSIPPSDFRIFDISEPTTLDENTPPYVVTFQHDSS